MPVSKKIGVGNGSLLENLKKALRQCRWVFLKDLEVFSVMDYMASEEGFRPDQRDAILALPTREQQAAAFLDHLESKGERAFALFVEALKTRQRPLYAYLEETFRTDDERDACRNAERTSITGIVLRKIFLKRKRESVVQGGEDGENATDKDELPNYHSYYTPCYSVTTKGQLQKEKWITHVDSCRTDPVPTEEKSYMAVVSTNLIFRRIDWTAVKPRADFRRPPNNNIPTYLFEKESDQVFSSAPKQMDGDFVSASLLKREKKNEEQTEEEKESKNCLPAASVRVRSSLPPPVPPKPAILPVVASGCGPPFPKQRKTSDVQDVAPPVGTTSRVSLPNSKAKPPVPKNKPSLRVPLSHLAHSGVQTQTEFPVNLTLSSNCELKEIKSEVCKLASLVETNLDDEGVDTVFLDYNISIGSIMEPEGLQKGENNVSDTTDTISSTKSGNQNDDHLDINENMMKNALDTEPTEIETEQSDNVKIKLTEEPTEESLNSDEKTNRQIQGELVHNQESPQISNTSNCQDFGDDRIFSKNGSEAECARYDLPPAEALNGESSPKTSESVPAEETVANQNLFLPSRSIDQTVFADDEFSSDNSCYEEIEQFFCERSSPSCRSYSAYLDPHVSLLRKRSSVRSSHNHATQELQKSGRKFLCRNSLLLVSCDTRYIEHKFPSDSSDVAEIKNESQQELDFSAFSDTLLCYDRDGSAFYVPSRFLKSYGDPEGEVWFYPVKISSRQASLFLRSVGQEGCFVVYRPEGTLPPVAYNLSLCLASNDVVHYHILEHAHGDYGIEGHDHTFVTVGELVEYFQRNKSSLATRLRRPLRIANHPITPGYHYDSCYELDRGDILLTGNIIGQGNFGVVCSGLYRKTPVAVKVLQQADNLTAADEDDFIEEAVALMGLRHDHIICLIGVSCKMRPYFLVTEYMSQGNLKDCLRNGFISSDDIEMLFSVCIQVVLAMQYLENIRFMLHRDLASRNFLVNDNLVVKLADFGRARMVSDDCYQAPRTERICIKWAAPEVLIYSRYSTKSDVWSFGVVLWEVLSAGSRPYSIFSGEQTAMYVTGGGRLDKPLGCPSDLYEVMKSCWCEEPDDRPSFCELSQTLKNKSNIYVSKSSVQHFHSKRLSSNVAKPSPILTTEKNIPEGKIATPIILGAINLRRTTFYDDKNSKSDTNNENHVRCKSDTQYILNHEGPLSNYLSDFSVATASSEVVDIDREDVSRGDRIRKSLRKLITKKSKTKLNDICGKPVPASQEYIAVQ